MFLLQGDPEMLICGQIAMCTLRTQARKARWETNAPVPADPRVIVMIFDVDVSTNNNVIMIKFNIR